MNAGQRVELRRNVATTLCIIEKGKKGSVESEQNGWLFVRFDGTKFLIPVQACEVVAIEAEAQRKGAALAAAAALLVMLLSGCFAPDLSKAMLLCDGVSRFCPEGFSCVKGVCSQGGEVVSDGGSVSDIAALVDLGKPSGCRDGQGTDTSGNGIVFACAGTFEASSDPTKSASRLCAVSWKLCTSGAGVSGALCSGLDGFFLAEVPARATLPSTGCGAARAGESPGLAGCGKAVSGVYAVPSCAGFRSALFAGGGSGLSVSLPYALDGASANITPSNGVLCCK